LWRGTSGAKQLIAGANQARDGSLVFDGCSDEPGSRNRQHESGNAAAAQPESQLRGLGYAKFGAENRQKDSSDDASHRSDQQNGSDPSPNSSKIFQPEVFENQNPDQQHRLTYGPAEKPEFEGAAKAPGIKENCGAKVNEGC
jgi:hypothetical protein